MFEATGGGGVSRAVWVLPVGLVAVVVAATAWWWVKEPDVAPTSDYGPSVPAGARTMDGIDLSTLHGELWGAVSVGEEASARDAVRGALEADPSLHELASSLLEAIDARDAREADDLSEVYNAALHARGMPWAIKTGRASGVYVKSYWLAGRPVATLGEVPVEVSLGVRADHLNVREGWLGIHEKVGGSLVVVDRVVDFAIDDVWPALSDDSSPQGLGLRAAAAGRMAPEALEVLLRTSEARRGMVDAQRTVDERRDCGSNFRMRLEWDGLDEIGLLHQVAARDDREDCPGITRAEASAVSRGTLAVRAEPELPDALEALVAWLSRHVVYHEARHAQDQEEWGSSPRCQGCEGMSDGAVSEMSAYVTAFASDEAVVAWVQGCNVLSADARGAGPRALRRLVAELEAPCDAAPPADLSERAAALASAWFDRTEAAQVADMPERLPLFLAR